MPELRNQTAFITAVVPGLDKEGVDYATVVIKGTFDIKNKGEALPVSEEQIPLLYAPEYYGEPGTSSIKYDSDIPLTKLSTDIALIGHAWARKGQQESVDVSLKVGALIKSIRVFGHRKWYKSLGMWHKTRPVPFEKMPLTYENAFGGIDLSHEKTVKQGREERNPVGKGFCISGEKKYLNGLSLPNLEDPRKPLNKWKDRPQPQAFGFVSPDWEPRIRYAGTYDDIWQKNRLPYLPEDFDPFFFNSAHPDLVTRKYLSGGEPVAIKNASQDEDLSFLLPKKEFCISVWIKGERKDFIPNLDTVVIEPDENRLILTWRSAIPCPGTFLYINLIRIKENS